MTDRKLTHAVWPILVILLASLALAGVVGVLLNEVGMLGERHPTYPWIGGGVVASVVAALLIDAMFKRRLRRLNDALIEAAAHEGESSALMRSTAELQLLERGIDQMVATLRRNYEDLKAHDALRRSMVANVSHELRTPLTSIQGYLETTRLQGPQSEDFEKNLDICIRETRRLSRLVQDLFQLSKLDNDQLDFHFESVPLVEVADQIGLAFEQRVADKELAFVTDFPDDEVLDVWGDGNRLGQVVQNLIGNAIVFTPPGGTITLGCRRDGERAELWVEDTGIGIPPKDLPHIFESFFHLEKSRTRNLGGTGLGLAICKAIVEKHGGEIAVTSELSEGTRFTVHLPLEDDEEAAG